MLFSSKTTIIAAALAAGLGFGATPALACFGCEGGDNNDPTPEQTFGSEINFWGSYEAQHFGAADAYTDHSGDDSDIIDRMNMTLVEVGNSGRLTGKANTCPTCANSAMEAEVTLFGNALGVAMMKTKGPDASAVVQTYDFSEFKMDAGNSIWNKGIAEEFDDKN